MEHNEEYIDTDFPTGDEPQGGDGQQPSAPTAKDPVADELKEMRAEMKNLRTRLSETETDARFWREQAKGGAKPEAEPEEEDIDAGEDLLEVFSSGDAKRVVQSLKKLGFTRQQDVQGMIGSTRQEMTAQAALYGKYPDLQDPNSEFFAETAKIYNELAQDPAFKKSGKTIEVAARMAAAELGTSAPRQKGGRRDEVDEYDERETERVRRVSSQAGERGRPRSRSGRDTGDESSNELNAMQRNLIAKFRAAGSSVSEEGYRKRAESGVRMSGLPTRGRR